MGLLTPCSVPRGGFFYTVIVPRGEGFCSVQVVSRGMVLDEIYTCIRTDGSACRVGSLKVLDNQAIPKNDQNTIPTNQGAIGSKLDWTSMVAFIGSGGGGGGGHLKSFSDNFLVIFVTIFK